MKIENSTILIVGGASLVGSHMTREFLQRGAAEIRILDPLAFDGKSALGALATDDRVQMISGDIMRLSGLVDAARGADGAVNLAAYMTLPMARDPWSGIDVNVRGQQNFLEAARISGVRKVLFASSSAVYGYGFGGDVHEDRPLVTKDVPPAGALYGASKVMGEQLCRYYHGRYGLDYVVLRYSTVYGEGQHYRAANALYIIEAYDRIARGEAPVIRGDGAESKNFVYAGDVAVANALAFESPATDMALNISGDETVSLKQLADMVLRLAGSDLEPEFRPDEAGGVRLPSGDALRYVNDRAKTILGWQPETPLETGIGRLIAWRRENPGE